MIHTMRYLLCLLFSLMAGVAHAAPVSKAYMSIIIDDLGQSTERDSRTLALPGPVTMAIMPDTPHATDFARQAHKAGKTVILHMPMDPATGPMPGTRHSHRSAGAAPGCGLGESALRRRHQQPHGQPHDGTA